MGPSGHHLRAIVARGDFRRLLSTRVPGQFGDGLFQAGLAGSVLFNPDRHTDPLAVALGFAVLLLPYSVVGPFVGVFLDRWSRRTVLVVANLVRSVLVPTVALMVWHGYDAIGFLLLTLIVIGVNRFILAGLSASLPHVTEVDHLATANAASTTSGALAFATGVGCAVGLQGALGTSNHGYALVSVISVLGYLLASAIAAGFPRGHLGPDAADRADRPRVGEVARGMVEGWRHLRERPAAANALGAITAHRLLFGTSMISILLLYRNYFTDDGFFQAGAVGLGQVFGASAAGAFVAATITPYAIRRLTPRIWVTMLLLLTGLVQITLGALYRMEAFVLAGLLVGLAAQGIKIDVDTTVQYECDDDYQGRVFSVYDTLFNISFVIGLLLGALTLPENGRSYAVVFAVAAGYVVAGAAYAWASARWPGRLNAALHPPQGPNPKLAGRPSAGH